MPQRKVVTIEDGFIVKRILTRDRKRVREKARRDDDSTKALFLWLHIVLLGVLIALALQKDSPISDQWPSLQLITKISALCRLS
jgi:hypothetical protein